ncbi:hypothetical protein [Roseixanthobacter pseudopolyaromaticivorans]|uniref:hypothetical protein n=1 Tax=Xanthobacteraceae TaxID=335928 RepID=UPI003727F2D5
MARIRTIKPELFKHESLFDLEARTGLPVRLAFMGLFTCCDREGRFKWRPRALKVDVMPYDDVDFSAVLDAMEAGGFVTRYEVDGESFGYIPSFSRHQNVNLREAASTIPAPESATHMQSSAMHVHAYAPHDDAYAEQVHAYGEGKGREKEEEGKGNEELGFPAHVQVHEAGFPRDRSSLDALEDALRQAGADELDPTSPALCQLSPILNCLDGGCDLELDIIPTIREVVARRKRKPDKMNRKIGSWEFFRARIFEARDRRLAPEPPEQPDERHRHHRPQGRPSGAARNVAALAEAVARRTDPGFSAADPGGTGADGGSTAGRGGDIIPFGLTSGTGVAR